MTTNNQRFTRHKLWTALAALIAATGIGAALFGQQGSKGPGAGRTGARHSRLGGHCCRNQHHLLGRVLGPA